MGFQETTSPSSAFAAFSAESFGTLPYAAGCAANRSVSMDSEASSYSPLPKRHRLYSCQVPDTPDAHVQSCHWQQHQKQQPASLPQQQQHASAQPPSLSDAQKLYAIKTTLQNSSAQQASALIAYMQQLQRLQTAAACQTNTAQTGCVQQTNEHHNFSAQARKILKVRHHLIGQQQHMLQQQQLMSRLIHSASIDCTRSADSFMHQLPDIQTPVQQQELQASSVTQFDSEAYWQAQHRAAPKSAPYETAQLHAHHLSYHSHHQPEQLWQSLLHSTQSSAPASELHNSQAYAAYPAGHLLRVQQQASMLQQLTRAKHASMQHHLAQEQQAYAQRQLPTVPAVRPAMGFAELVGYWAHGLDLQRCESVQLACHLWKRVQQQVSIAYMHLLGAEKPWETMLLGCLWLAAKLEECRRGVPTASRVGALLGVDCIVMGGVELYLMQLVSWAPLLEWKDRPLLLEDDSWY